MDGILKQLNFKLASYTIEGDFLGFQDLTHQLFVCEVGEEDVEKFTTIGSTIDRTCLFDLGLLTNPLTFPRHTNLFFDLFLVDYNGDLIDVPVRIDGAAPLYRRFFMLDTLSGLQEADSYVNGGQAAYLRYASTVRLKI